MASQDVRRILVILGVIAVVMAMADIFVTIPLVLANTLPATDLHAWLISALLGGGIFLIVFNAASK